MEHENYTLFLARRSMRPTPPRYLHRPLFTLPHRMSFLRHLHLGGNFFTGKIPPEYGVWSHLEYLAVSGNELSGPIPPEIGNLTSLQAPPSSAANHRHHPFPCAATQPWGNI
ncbi:unnamed protein product [Lathyrus oleraceus]